MASIWLEPISHETLGTYRDPIKLRRPLQISQIRISKPQVEPLRIEFLARNLRTPSDELISIKQVERPADPTSQDIVVNLEEAVLTNFLVVEGEYLNLSLCLEATEPLITHNRISLKPVGSI